MAVHGKTASMVAKMQRSGLHVEHNGDQWSARVGAYRLSLTDQDGEVLAIHVQRLTEHADLLTDYYPGSYFPSLARAMRFIDRYNAEEASH